MEYSIEYTSLTDLEVIQRCVSQAIYFQKENMLPVWPEFDTIEVVNDILDKVQYKLLIENKMAFIFKILESDRIIWRDYERDDAIYIHGMIVHPDFRGERIFKLVLDWVARQNQWADKKWIRMDTWANNLKLINYYKTFGFKIIEYYKTPNSKRLPKQQRGNEVVLLQKEFIFHDKGLSNETN